MTSAVRMGWIVAAVVLALLLYAVFVFNRLVRLRNLVREGWSGIDVQLRQLDDDRRFGNAGHRCRRRRFARRRRLRQHHASR